MKAIYTLEAREDAASTTALAARLEVRPASVSGMLRKLDRRSAWSSTSPTAACA